MFSDLFRNIKTALQIGLMPLQFIALVIEIIIGVGFLVVVGAGVAWWRHMIPDQTVIAAVNAVGARALGVLQAQGVYGGIPRQP